MFLQVSVVLFTREGGMKSLPVWSHVPSRGYGPGVGGGSKATYGVFPLDNTDTDTDKKGFNYNMQNCSDLMTQTPTQMQMGCKPILSVSVSVPVSASVNAPLPPLLISTGGHCSGGTHPTGMHSCCNY